MTVGNDENPADAANVADAVNAEARPDSRSTAIRRWLLLIVLVLGVIAADQLTKGWILQNIAPGAARQPIPALADYFQITHSANTGVAFGLFPQAGDLVGLIAVAVVIGMVFFYPRLPDDAILSRIAIGLIAGGALGNVLDRVQHGHVVDFINYRIPGVISNVSNLADHAIFLGVIIILLEGLVFNRPQDGKSVEVESPQQSGDESGEPGEQAEETSV